MTFKYYSPERPVTGPAYNRIFKIIASIVILLLVAYGLQAALKLSLMELSFGVKAILAFLAVFVGLSYYWFLRATVTIDEQGITQKWIIDRSVAWNEITGVKVIGIPFLGRLFPPRMIVRAGSRFTTFNGGSPEVVTEFEKISLAYRARK